MLFTGLKGIGKATFAHRLAKFLLVHGRQDTDTGSSLFGDEALPATFPTNMNTNPNETDIRLYLNNAHPDCKVVERLYDDSKNTYKPSVEVDEVRKITPFLHMKSHSGGWRIVIIDDADTMNRNAQNAILKILEEPPKKTVIILIAHRPGRLIPTIHSRTQRVAFSPLSDQTVTGLVEKSSQSSLSSAEAMAQAVSMAHGSVGEALDMLEEGGSEYLQIFFQLLSSYPRTDWALVHKQADMLSKKGANAYPIFTRMVLKSLQNVIASKGKNKPMADFFLKQSGIVALHDNNSLDKLLGIYDKLDIHFQKIEHANLDKKQGILHAMQLICQ